MNPAVLTHGRVTPRVWQFQMVKIWCFNMLRSSKLNDGMGFPSSETPPHIHELSCFFKGSMCIVGTAQHDSTLRWVDWLDKYRKVRYGLMLADGKNWSLFRSSSFSVFSDSNPFVGPRCPTGPLWCRKRYSQIAGGFAPAWRARMRSMAVVAGVERVPLDLVHITLEDFNVTLS